MVVTFLRSVSSVQLSGRAYSAGVFRCPVRPPVPAETDGLASVPAEIYTLAHSMWRVPTVWLTLVPLILLGTTTMPAARMNDNQTAGNAHVAIVQFSCGCSTITP